jgi:hypothetical protein
LIFKEPKGFFKRKGGKEERRKGGKEERRKGGKGEEEH